MPTSATSIQHIIGQDKESMRETSSLKGEKRGRRERKEGREGGHSFNLSTFCCLILHGSFDKYLLKRETFI